MTEILKAVLFGIVEGVTEWLPISSTGHLILLNEAVTLNVSEGFRNMFDVVIQLGAIAAVAVLFFPRLNPYAAGKSTGERQRTWRLWGLVLLSILPSGAVGVVLDDWMEANLHSPWVVSVALIVYGVAFLLTERGNRERTPRVRSVEEMTPGTALAIGCFQCLSLVPGTSRSGSTILGGILLGASREAAAQFSFFMAIPTMLGASAVKLLKFFLRGTGFTGMELWVLAVGSATAFFVSLLVIRGLMEYVREHSFSAFGVYRIILGAVVLLRFAL